MRLIITEKNVGDWAAAYVAKKILDFKPNSNKKFILGLPTGSTPLQMYKRLIQFYKDGLISFKNIITFNMDEYVGLDPKHPQSYHYYMYENFFKHIDIEEDNINILNGMAENYILECKKYEDKIKELGGIDLFLGGIGVDGHIAFNEPGSSLSSRTRAKELTEDTIINNSRFFDGDVNKVPKLALTVGVKTIMDAREVLIMVNGLNKARALHHGIECGINHLWTISALQLHEKALIVADEDACAEIKVGLYKYYKDIEKANLDSDKLINELYLNYSK
ncbi:MAG: glucosamine-6-phosphate deaminase [Fusobacterium sp.]|uniref:glucosamine-6-phosphate deaminase n=1 Tax=Fusobacterium sp. TaxID=68766 RepID=UPI0026DD732C|nr:glucosamine-6-phosphate deaminase [Fusobacterium sp.]MDO4690827.1 glucosamine-6-phosphate deaminase [Fusobacterium sp.]